MKLDENTKAKWNEHSSKYERTPPIDRLLEFLDLQARHRESFSHSVRSVPKPKATTKAAYTMVSENRCVARKKGTHPLSRCGKFQGMSRNERWELLNSA